MSSLQSSSDVVLKDRDVYLVSVTEGKDWTGKVTHHYLYGWKTTESAASHPRQTLITELATDPLCPMLSTLPPDENSCVCLASDGYELHTDSAKGEMVYYYFTVTERRPLVVVKHAAVLENPQHPLINEYPRYATPWCNIGVYVNDSLYERLSIDNNPAFPATISGFQPFTDTNGRQALWLDWRTDTIDVSEFIGQRIAIGLDCRDCSIDAWKEGTKLFNFCQHHHLARMYAHISCQPIYHYVCEGTFTAPDTVCADAHGFELANGFTPGSVVAYDLLFCQSALDEGFEDCKSLKLRNDTASIPVTIPQLNPSSYPRPQDYSLDLVLHTVCDNDTVIHIRFSLMYPSWVIYQRWNDVVSVANTKYNGGYEISAVEWYSNGRSVAGHGSWYQEKDGFRYDAVNATGDSVSSVAYSARLTRADDGKKVCTCDYYPVKQENKIILDVAVSVYHSPDRSRIYAAANKSGEIAVYSCMGLFLYKSAVLENSTVELPVVAFPAILVFTDGKQKETLMIWQ